VISNRRNDYSTGSDDDDDDDDDSSVNMVGDET
jgi:hypothetical protein